MFIAKCLKLDNITLLGLVKLEAYHTITKKITENVDAEQLIDDINKAFDSLKAELKPPPSPPAEELDNYDNAIDNDSNVILSSLNTINLETATEAAS
ncbi:hypothetical protein C0995_012003 [Termitomyces sp. Mi166|nr:hypothetical protein C0995_012003 [Termitomyces sp. Mi166\